MSKQKKIIVEGTEISLTQNEIGEFFSLTDIAKKFNSDNPSTLIVNWMRNKDTVEFLGVWEKLHNEDFNLIEFDKIKLEMKRVRIVLYFR